MLITTAEKTKMNNFLKNFLKLSISGAIVFGVGFAFLTLYPTADNDGLETKETQADIASFSFLERSNTQKFVDSLDRIGHSEPREYDMNGNQIFFSTWATEKSPKEVYALYQRKFVEEGLNSEVHPTVPPGEKMLKENIDRLMKATSKGEIIPYAVSDHKVVMGGAEIKRGPDKKLLNIEKDPNFADGVDKLVRNRTGLQHALVECGYGDQIGKVKTNGVLSDVMKDARINVGKAAAKQTNCAAGASDGRTCNQLRSTYDTEMKKLDDLKGILTRFPDSKKCPAVDAVLRAGKVEKMSEFEQAIESFQTVEAYRRPGTSYTQVTATWSGDKYDATRNSPNRHGFPEDVDGDKTTLPKCDSCRRTWVFNGSGKESHLGTELLETHESPALVEDWYKKRMQHKGWKLSESTEAIKELQRLHPPKTKSSRWLHFVNEDNTFMTVRIRREKGITKIIGERSN